MKEFKKKFTKIIIYALVIIPLILVVFIGLLYSMAEHVGLGGSCGYYNTYYKSYDDEGCMCLGILGERKDERHSFTCRGLNFYLGYE